MDKIFALVKMNERYERERERENVAESQNHKEERRKHEKSP